jgi:hypothetical protein
LIEIGALLAHPNHQLWLIDRKRFENYDGANSFIGRLDLNPLKKKVALPFREKSDTDSSL